MASTPPLTRTVQSSAGALIWRETTRSHYHRVDGKILIGDHRAPWIPAPAHAPG